MKKTNFLVVFWLLIALISFVIFLFSFKSIFESLSYLLIPSKDSYWEHDDFLRDLISSVPMLTVTLISFFISLKQGLKTYKTN